MHSALLMLLRLQHRGQLRRIWLMVKTPRKAIFLVATVAWAVLIIGPSFVMAFAMDRGDSMLIRTFGPLALLVLCMGNLIFTGGERAVHFKPAEVYLLFSGPFSRRDLLIYKVIQFALGSLFGSLLISLYALRFCTWWIAVFAGLFLTFAFMQLLSMAVVLVRQMISEHAYTRGRRLILAAIGVLVAFGAWSALWTGLEDGVVAAVQTFQSSGVGTVVLAPFMVLVRTFTAGTLFPGFVAWGTLALCMNLALLILVIRLDADYTEVAVSVSRKVYKRLEQMKRGSVAAPIKAGASWYRVPALPWLGGAGPLAWQQLMHALRTSQSALMLLFFVGLASGPTLVGMMGKGEAVVGEAVGLSFMVAGILGFVIPFGFPSAKDSMDWLKMLPIGAVGIAAGEMAVPVCLITAVQLLFYSGVTILNPDAITVLLLAVLYLIPFNILFVGIVNFVFLLFPTRAAAGPGDLQNFGGHLIFMFLIMLTLVVVGGTAAGLGGIAYWLTKSWPVFIVISWVTLAMGAAGTLPMVAWAFERFDVGVDRAGI